MSTTAEIVNDVKQLIISIDELLKTSTAKEAPNIARDLGAETQLNAAIDLFVNLLNDLKNALLKLTDSFIQADAAVASLEIVAACLKYFGKGEALSEITEFFEIKNAPFQPVLVGFSKVGAYLEAGLGLADSIPTPEDLANIGVQLTQLTVTISSLKAKPAVAALPSQGALPAPAAKPALPSPSSSSATRPQTTG